MRIDLNLKHGKFVVEVPDDAVPDKALSNGGHPLNFVKLPATKTYLDNIHDLLGDLPKGLKVVDMFAGIGLFPLILWDSLEPESWTSVELDQGCIDLFQERRASVVKGDVYKYDQFAGAGLVICDFGTNTILKIMRNEEGRHDFFSRIAKAKPRFWEITDVGWYWIHLANHHPHYITRFGEKPHRDRYHLYFDTYMRDEFGYRVVDFKTGGGCQNFLLEPV
jgi:hypothetical protein